MPWFISKSLQVMRTKSHPLDYYQTCNTFTTWQRSSLWLNLEVKYGWLMWHPDTNIWLHWSCINYSTQWCIFSKGYFISCGSSKLSYLWYQRHFFKMSYHLWGNQTFSSSQYLLHESVGTFLLSCQVPSHLRLNSHHIEKSGSITW